MFFNAKFNLLLAILLISLGGGAATAEIIVRVDGVFFNPNVPGDAYTQATIEMMRQEPGIRVRQWGGISLPSGAQASLMMSLAGGSAPDLGLSYFHTVGNDIKQNFLYPLNEWVGEDTDGNGVLDDDEVKWKEWLKFRSLWRRLVSQNGKIYGVPVPITAIQAVIFRTDMVKAAGLDPNHPPKDWGEFYEWCKRLTDPEKQVQGAYIQQGQRAIALPTDGYQFLPWIQSAGGEPFVQVYRSPKTGRSYEFPIDAETLLTEDGEDLSREVPEWRASWDTTEGRAALDFWYKLRWGKFERDGQMITGVARLAASLRGQGMFELLGNGEVAMTIASVDDLDQIGVSAKIDPGLLSWFPVPAAPGPKGRRVVQIFQHYAVMYAGVAERSKAERDAVWRSLLAVTSPEVLDNSVRRKTLAGMSRFISPEYLKQLGYEEYIREVPVMIRRNFEEMERGEILSKTEPYAGYWLVINDAFSRQVLGIMLGANGEKFDHQQAFRSLQTQANSGMMFEVPEEFLVKYRPWSKFIALVMAAMIGVFVWKIIFSHKIKQGTAKSVHLGWLPVLLLIPALAIIGCWCYYPLLRGMVMALQDYKIVGDSKFVGLDNFIVLAADRSFWMSIGRTLYFVVLNMLMAFLAPIALAILLTEVPRGKIFYRTLFFLPQMTSGIVIALMWKMMYAPTPAGFFNQLLAYLNYLPGFDIGAQTWLEDPKLAMICCIVPTVWAGMGMSSLIYLAALQSLPKELYEAAEIDGAGFFRKFTRITVPYLLPLIVINFVGTFIATFQGMGNIFLMTFGGPGESTMVIGLKIWQEAYMNLRFSMATSMAWVMGAGLIGLTYVQIQFLKKVEYKRAAD